MKDQEDKRLARRDKELDKIKQQDEKRKEEREAKDEEKKVQKTERDEKRKEEWTKRKEDRQKAKEDWKTQKKEIEDRNYVYKSIEQNYKDKIELPSLEERKQILNEKRNFYKPIRREEIDDFEKDYQEKK